MMVAFKIWDELSLNFSSDKLIPWVIKNWFMLSVRISSFIIQQIVTLSKYGHDALDIRHP